jgi:hypothetical protein
MVSKSQMSCARFGMMLAKVSKPGECAMIGDEEAGQDEGGFCMLFIVVRRSKRGHLSLDLAQFPTGSSV